MHRKKKNTKILNPNPFYYDLNDFNHLNPNLS